MKTRLAIGLSDFATCPLRTMTQRQMNGCVSTRHEAPAHLGVVGKFNRAVRMVLEQLPDQGKDWWDTLVTDGATAVETVMVMTMHDCDVYKEHNDDFIAESFHQSFDSLNDTMEFHYCTKPLGKIWTKCGQKSCKFNMEFANRARFQPDAKLFEIVHQGIRFWKKRKILLKP